MLLVSIIHIYLLYLTKDLAKIMKTTMVETFTGSSSMATVFKATPSQPPLCNSMAEGTAEGFFYHVNLQRKK
jgi:hypothetical protein